MSFNHYYQSELTALRQLGRRFAERRPALAPFLGQAGRDPDVGRLLEGFAFLIGRLRQKLDDELPELGWHIGLVLKVWFKVGVMVGKIWRNFLVRGGLVVALFAVIYYCVKTMLGCPADLSILSPSGRYEIQNVPVGRVLMFGGMAYLKVIDKQNPEAVYRSPLYEVQSLDMRAFESEDKVGIYWVSFDRVKKAFAISMPEWKESLFNVFISNVPYTHLENN